MTNAGKPGLLNLSSSFDVDSPDTCEEARWSAYISADMKMMPCSFDNQKQKWAVDLRKNKGGLIIICKKALGGFVFPGAFSLTRA